MQINKYRESQQMDMSERERLTVVIMNTIGGCSRATAGEVVDAILACGAVVPSKQALNELGKKIHDIAERNGEYGAGIPLPEILCQCSGALSEAFKEYGSGNDLFWESAADPYNPKPEGVAAEMIDCVLRILVYLARMGVDIDAVMAAKIAYNQTRSHRHGGKVC